MKRVATRIAPLAFGLVVASAFGAVAQEADTDLTDSRNQSVMERVRPGYDAAGIRAGGFLIFPDASVSESYNDNIYATPTNETDDFITTLAANVAVISTWSRHALNLRGGLSQDFFADNNDEDRLDWNVGGDGRIDVTSSTALKGSLNYAQLHENRGDPSAPTAASEPVEYKLFTASADISQRFNRVEVNLGGDYADFNYDDVTSVLGATIDQDDRDREEYAERLRFSYLVSPDTNVYLEGQLDQRKYDQQPPVVALNRDSDGWQIVAGSEFRLTNLAQGGLYVGYQEREYDDATLSDTDGIAYGANIDWFMTPLTTVVFSAESSVEETTVGGASGYDEDRFGVSVDHELMRNVILSGGASYTTDDFNDTPRQDDILGAHAGVKYLLNHNFDIGLGYTYTDRDSNAAGFDYTRNVVGLTLTGKL
ncbi:MAG: hypothetical protein CVT83_00780 [Alphaproteobacteria bacterium HGW-Alphaproteobacteria-5]|nr:MAG: hypothetical protein CVT83_00780 [Alphaproteobacteria bacterium HGW-Alphaproteobacteria-5]